MVASTNIKFYVHTNNNAPQLQNAYGSMINVLDACLIDGIQIGAVNSLTAVGSTVTATFGAAHNLMQYQVIKITGANQPEFNGEHRILTIPDSSSLTFELAAAPSVSTATGTISASLPPLGWEKPFSSSNPNGGGKAAYRSLNLLLSSRPFLRVVDELDPAYTATYAKYAKVGIVEDMTDIDTMLGVQAPFDPANPDKNWVATGSGTGVINGWAKWYWARSSHAAVADTAGQSNGIRQWLVVGSGNYFYVMPSLLPTANTNDARAATCYGFGEFERYYDNDVSSTFLSATLTDLPSSASFVLNSRTPLTELNVSGTTNKCVLLQRNVAQSASCGYAMVSVVAAGISSAYSGSAEYFTDNARVSLFPLTLVETSGRSNNYTTARGSMRGIYGLWHNISLPNNQIIVHNKDVCIAKQISTNTFNVFGAVFLKVGEL